MAARQPFSAVDYHNDPRRRVRSAIVRAAAPLLGRAGFDLELADYYSPIPHADDRPESWWEQPSPLPGVRLDLPAQLSFVRTELEGYTQEFSPPRTSHGKLSYHLDNGLFQGGDADLLYAMIRRFKPQLIYEIGAGFSTLVAAMAACANLAEGCATRLVSFDPYAVAPAPGAVPGLGELRPVAAQDIPTADFQSLQAGDILFIDSSHTVKIGGDVVHLLTEVLPSLASGVIVHLHDVYLPWPYPRAWVARTRWYWAEQYMLQALLAENDHWEVLVACYALSRMQPTELTKLVPNVVGSPPPLSFWLRRVTPV